MSKIANNTLLLTLKEWKMSYQGSITYLCYLKRLYDGYLCRDERRMLV